MIRKLILIILVLGFGKMHAQSIDDLRNILAKSKSSYIKPDELDRLMIQMRHYRENPMPDQDSLVLEIYKSISMSYLISSHYKQGYQVYNNYLTYKEQILHKDKSEAITKAMNTIGERTRNNDDELRNLKFTLEELKKENTKLSVSLVSFKSNFALILIVLSVIFAVVLSGYSIRSFNLRSRLNFNRDTMKNIHHLALTGRYEEGVRNALQSSMNDVNKEINELKEKVK